MIEQKVKPNCPYCNSTKTKKFGFRPRVKGKIQQFICNDCGKVFTYEQVKAPVTI